LGQSLRQFIEFVVHIFRSSRATGRAILETGSGFASVCLGVITLAVISLRQVHSPFRTIPCDCFLRQADRREGNSRKAGSEFLQRSSAGDGLGQVFGKLIEFIVHSFVAFWFVVVSYTRVRLT
jgi:hypothetical protein